MSGTQGNSRYSGQIAKNDAYRDAVGMTPGAFEVLVAVMAYERCYGLGPTGSDVRRLLGFHDLCLNELVGGLWVSVEGASNGTASKRLTARARAWNSFGVSKNNEARTA